MSTAPTNALESPVLKTGFFTFLGIVYAIGFFVQTSHLSRFGVFDSAAIKAQYILTGCLAISPLMVPHWCLVFICTAIAIRTKSKMPSAPSQLKSYFEIVRAMAIAGLISLAGVAFLLAASVVVVIRNTSWQQFSELLFNVVSVFFAEFFVVFSVVHWDGHLRFRETKYDAPKPLVVAAVVSSIFLLLISLIVYHCSFTAIIYPNVDSAFGGGRALKVRVVPTAECPSDLLLRNSETDFVDMLLHGKTESAFLLSEPGAKSKMLQIRPDQILGLQIMN